jgi:hypothetical protein
MKPAIVHPRNNKAEAFLIDLHAIVKVEPCAEANGNASQLALKAVALKNLHAGEIKMFGDEIHPRPIQLAGWQKMTKQTPMFRGIFPDAAAALLAMPHGYKTEVAPGGDFTVARPAAGWNQWHFVIAWSWSAWQGPHRLANGEKWPLERRWEALKAIGYPDGFSAFRMACSRLGLSVTKSRPNM